MRRTTPHLHNLLKKGERGFACDKTSMSFAFYDNGFTGTLKIGTQTILNSSYRLINEAGALPTGFDFTFEEDLTGMHGFWTLIMKQSDAQMIPPPSGAQPLIFRFSVPA